MAVGRHFRFQVVDFVFLFGVPRVELLSRFVFFHSCGVKIFLGWNRSSVTLVYFCVKEVREIPLLHLLQSERLRKFGERHGEETQRVDQGHPVVLEFENLRAILDDVGSDPLFEQVLFDEESVVSSCVVGDGASPGMTLLREQPFRELIAAGIALEHPLSLPAQVTRLGFVIPAERAHAIGDAQVGGVFEDFSQLVFTDDLVLPAFEIVEHVGGNGFDAFLHEPFAIIQTCFLGGCRLRNCLQSRIQGFEFGVTFAQKNVLLL